MKDVSKFRILVFKDDLSTNPCSSPRGYTAVCLDKLPRIDPNGFVQMIEIGSMGGKTEREALKKMEKHIRNAIKQTQFFSDMKMVELEI